MKNLIKQLALGLSFTIISTYVYSVPKWVETPLARTGYISAIGLGDDINKAKQSAAAQIGKTLYSNVSSNISIKVKTLNEELEEQTFSSSSIQSNNVLLPTISWEKIEAEGGIYYALGSVKQADLIQLYNKNLTIALKPFDNLLAKKSLNLNDYLILVANKKTLQIAAERASAVSSYSNKAQNHFEDIEVLLKKQNDFIGSACFRVKKSNHRLVNKIYLPAIESAVMADRFELKNLDKCFPISFIAKSVKSEQVIANVTMQINIGEPSIVNKIVKFKGQSTGSYKAAMFDAADNFKNYFQNNGGLLSVLLLRSGETINIEL